MFAKIRIFFRNAYAKNTHFFAEIDKQRIMEKITDFVQAYLYTNKTQENKIKYK